MFDYLLTLFEKNLYYRDFSIFGQMTVLRDPPAFRLELESNSIGHEVTRHKLLNAPYPDCW
jgi:hypothetical protein